MVFKLADGSKEKMAGAEAAYSIYCEEFGTRDMLFDFVKPVWLQYLDKKMD